jgi:hypothetical protein
MSSRTYVAHHLWGNREGASLQQKADSHSIIVVQGTAWFWFTIGFGMLTQRETTNQHG